MFRSETRALDQASSETMKFVDACSQFDAIALAITQNEPAIFFCLVPAGRYKIM